MCVDRPDVNDAVRRVWVHRIRESPNYASSLLGAPIERTHRFPFAPGLVPCRSLSALIILEPINHLTSEPPPATTSLFLSFSRGESPSYPGPREGARAHPRASAGPTSWRYAIEKSPGSCGLITMFRNNVLCHAVDCKLFGYKKGVHLRSPPGVMVRSASLWQ